MMLLHLEQVQRSQPREELAGRGGVGSLRLALIAVAHDPAVAEDESAVAAGGDARIVGGNEQREATLSSQSVEYGDNLSAGMGI